MKKTKQSKTTRTISAGDEITPVETHSCCCNCRPSFGLLKTVSICASILGAGIIVSTSILMRPMPQMIRSTVPIPSPRINDATMRKYIEANPKIIMNSIEKYMKDNEKKEAEKAKPAAPQPKIDYTAIVNEIAADKSNYSMGNPNGKFIIVEFFDHQCGWCKRTNAGLHEAISKPEGKNIRWIAIDTPIFGAKSEEIARYVLAAGKQGKYAQMHEAVGKEGSVDKEKLIAIATKIGLDTKKLEADANSDELKNKLTANRKYSEQLHISGVPFLIINGKPNPGALLNDKLASTVKESQNVK